MFARQIFPMRRRRIPFALALVSTLIASMAQAGPAALFETNAGAFVLDLNPTDDPNLQVHVDNIVQYIDTNRYIGMVINRADPGFVVQMGGFSTDTLDPTEVGTLDTSPGFSSIPTFDPVIVDDPNDSDILVDFPTLSNARGTVSLALSSFSGSFTTNPNSGTSSFFINQTDNAGLDPQGFVPFARVRDMAFFDRIDSGPRTDLGPQLGFSPGGLAFGDVPLADDELVVVSQVLLIPEPTAVALVGLAGLAGVFARRR